MDSLYNPVCSNLYQKQLIARTVCNSCGYRVSFSIVNSHVKTDEKINGQEDQGTVYVGIATTQMTFYQRRTAMFPLWTLRQRHCLKREVTLFCKYESAFFQCLSSCVLLGWVCVIL